MLLKTTKLFFLSVAVLLLSCERVAVADDKDMSISSLDEFLEFVNSVNSGSSTYKDHTVTLLSDIDFWGNLFTPIGTGSSSSSSSFCGTFEGNGHVISNLSVAGSASVAGLFGVVGSGCTVRNVVLDGSCSISTTATEESVYVGSIVGRVLSGASDVSIEDCVSMASVEYDSGSALSTLSVDIAVGGILGGGDGAVRVLRCANYGSVSIAVAVTAASAGSTGAVYLGGIAGYIGSANGAEVRSCINNGRVTETGSAETRYVGGVAGHGGAASIQNSVSHGEVSVDGSGANVDAIAVTGSGGGGGSVSGCFYNGGLGYNSAHEGASVFHSLEDVRSQLNTVEEVWSVATFRYGSGVLVQGENQTGMECEDNSALVCATYLVLRNYVAPIVAADRKFTGWFTDNTFKTPANTNEFKESVTLYARFLYNLKISDGDEFKVDKYLNESESFTISVEAKINDKTCYEHTGWSAAGPVTPVKCEDGSYIMPGSDVELYPVLTEKVNTLTLIFVDNGTTSDMLVNCTTPLNTSAFSPPPRDGYTFSWHIDPGCTLTVPDYRNVPSDMPIYGCWKSNETKQQSSSEMSVVGGNSKTNDNVGLIVGIAVPVVVIICVVVSFIVYFIVVRSKRAENSLNLDDVEEGFVTKRRRGGDDVESGNENEDQGIMYMTTVRNDGIVDGGMISLNERKDLYSSGTSEYYRVPTLEEALSAAGLSGKPLETVVTLCSKKASEAIAASSVEGLEEKDAAALAMYTFDFGIKHYESNPFRLINKELAARSKEGLVQVSGMLYLVMTALRKLPRVTKRTLYRGVREGAIKNEGEYAEGSIVMWPAFSSTSPEMNTTKAFLAKDTADGNAAGILFIIEDAWGYDLQPYSLYPNEVEILMEPERRFVVNSVIKGKLTIITLKMIDSPPVLQDVFGEPRDTSV